MVQTNTENFSLLLLFDKHSHCPAIVTIRAVSDIQDWSRVHFMTKISGSSHYKNINGKPVPDIRNIHKQYGEPKNLLNSLATILDKSNNNHTKYPLLSCKSIFYRKILTYIWIFTFLCFVTKTYLKSINIR